MRDEQVRIRLKESTKDEWEAAADDQGLPVAQFVRRCVSLQLRSEETQDTFDDSAILERLDSLGTTLEGVRTRLQAVEVELQDDPKSRELETMVYGLLPERLMEIPDMDGRPDARMKDGRIVTGDPAHIAEYIRYSPDLDAEPTEDQVVRALEDLQSELHGVQELDGRWIRS